MRTVTWGRKKFPKSASRKPPSGGFRCPGRVGGHLACGAEKRLQTRRRDVRRVWRPATRPGRPDRLRLNYSIERACRTA
jgi:hypothetical protein